MFGDVDAARNPDFFLFTYIVEEFGETQGAARSAGQAAMQAHAHHFGGTALAFLIEAIEAVFQVLIKVLAGVEALRSGKAHIICI